ncbi:MAG: hypothetical protein NC926_02255 [Candidatus Omnitrophica bacterium]|nr:hypothetical protein [Candidatus Omnitrophota bacterium]
MLYKICGNKITKKVILRSILKMNLSKRKKKKDIKKVEKSRNKGSGLPG